MFIRKDEPPDKHCSRSLFCQVSAKLDALKQNSSLQLFFLVLYKVLISVVFFCFLDFWCLFFFFARVGGCGERQVF